jgi:hypothetical protein
VTADQARRVLGLESSASQADVTARIVKLEAGLAARIAEAPSPELARAWREELCDVTLARLVLLTSPVDATASAGQAYWPWLLGSALTLLVAASMGWYARGSQLGGSWIGADQRREQAASTAIAAARSEVEALTRENATLRLKLRSKSTPQLVNPSSAELPAAISSPDRGETKAPANLVPSDKRPSRLAMPDGLAGTAPPDAVRGRATDDEAVRRAEEIELQRIEAAKRDEAKAEAESLLAAQRALRSRRKLPTSPEEKGLIQCQDDVGAALCDLEGQGTDGEPCQCPDEPTKKGRVSVRSGARP